MARGWGGAPQMGFFEMFFDTILDIWNHPDTHWWAIVILILFLVIGAALVYLVFTGVLENLHIVLPGMPGVPEAPAGY